MKKKYTCTDCKKEIRIPFQDPFNKSDKKYCYGCFKAITRGG